MNDHKLYALILKISLALFVVSCGIIMLFFKDFMYVLSVLLGWVLSTLGFVFIIYMGENMSFSGNVRQKVVGAYMFRYIFYFIAMFIGAWMGLNILCMLVGFICLNIAIKVSAILTREEDD